MKKILNLILIFFFLFLVIEFMLLSNDIMESVKLGINLWLNNVFPSLFPFFVISNILANYGFIEFLSELFSPITRILKINKNASFVIGMSILSGSPSNAKYTKELYDKHFLNEDEASKVLTFTHFSNPLFVLGTLSISFLKNKEIGFLILIIHYFTNIIIAFLFKNYYISSNLNNKFSFKNAFIGIKNDKSFGKILESSITNSLQTLFLILGTIVFFLTITTIINHNIKLNNYYLTILNGILEMTQGLKYVSLLDVPLKIKAVLAVMMISFGGLSVHFQVISIISQTKIKYLPFLTARIIHATLAGIMAFYLFDLYILLI